VRVAIDARAAAFGPRTGVGVYTWELLRRLPAADPDATFVAWHLQARRLLGEPRALAEVEAPNLIERATPIPARWFERLARSAGVPRLEWLARFDVLFAPNFVPPPTRTRRLVVTVHDLAFRRMPESAPASTRRWLAGFDDWLDRAARVVAVSEGTRRDLLELTRVEEERVRVIPLGVDTSVFRPLPAAETRAAAERLGVTGPYVLSLGAIEPRKNLPALVEAFGRLPDGDRPWLVITGGGVRWNPEGERVLEAAPVRLRPAARGRVLLTGFVPREDVVALLSGALALAYPSRYEGFGLPVLEAMACGTPVLTSDVSALAEVAGDAAVLVDPERVESIAEGLERVLRDDALRERLRAAGLERAAGFTWDRTARRTAEVLRETAED
jgi:glycosyltransferase involved in cell wall biosynthesis